MNIPEYNYDFELSSKRKIFLWLHQVLPNIDVINLIYQMKDDHYLSTYYLDLTV